MRLIVGINDATQIVFEMQGNKGGFLPNAILYRGKITQIAHHPGSFYLETDSS